MRGRTARLALALGFLPVSPVAWARLNQSKKPADAFPCDVAWRWFGKVYDVVKTERTAPPPASRIYGITAVALYEAIVPKTLANRSLVGQLNDLTGVPQPARNKVRNE